VTALGFVQADKPGSRFLGVRGTDLWMTLLLGVVAFVVIYPIFSLLITSFQINRFGLPAVYGLDNWRSLYRNDDLSSALTNTVALASVRQLIAIVLGVGIAWLIARSNLPGRQWMEVGFWIALFMPILPVTLAWVFLLAGRTGVANRLLDQLELADGPVFNLYSFSGIVWVHLMTATLAVKVFLLVPAFRALDSSLEEAARASGATLLGTLRRVVVPIMAPTILAVLLLGLIRSMQGFEIELILGAPANIEVYSTIIYRTMTRDPPLYGVASALSITFLLSIVPLVVAQQWYGQRRRYASIGSRFAQRVFDLGRWKWPLFTLMTVLLFFMTVVPFVCLIAGTFMQIFGIFDMPNPWTVRHWSAALTDGRIARALVNSIWLGVTAAIAGMIVFTVIAYVTIRTKYIARQLLEFFTWLPALVPGVVLSLGLLQTFTGVALFRPFYGTLAVLVVAILIGTATVGTQIISGALRQLGGDLEEAGWASGGSRLYTFRRIVLPLILPSVAVIGLEIFATANAAVALIAFLGTGALQPLSILQLSLLEAGRFESAAIVGIFIMLLTVGSALLARALSSRFGLGRYAA
jgi:iron(III) transport system permease protein